MIFQRKGSGVSWLLVGLGNPGSKYESTRHNMGFLAVDGLAQRKGFRFNKLRFRAWTAEWMVNGEKVLVMKPQTYMNLSGEAVGEAARFYKIPADHVVVISDDISLPVGKLRIRTGGSAGGHNGLKNIIQHLGASCGTDPHLAQAVRELGAWIGAAGHTLVYGGSKTGLMGLLAQSALEQGGSVIGVEPECFMAQDLQYDGLTQLIVTRSMAERKAKMIQLGDAFIAFPGGTGTLEEITEVMSQVSLGQLSAPCILYDLDGYYCHLKALLDHMIASGLSSPERQRGIHFAQNLPEIQVLLS